jgi:putative heme-binding domain-containing protein
LDALTALAKEPAFAEGDSLTTIQEIIARDLTVLQGEGLTTSSRMPTALGAKTQLSDIPTIAKLGGDAARGQARAMICLMCHRLGAAGTPFGPNLAGWGAVRSTEQILKDIIHPSEHLAHGFDRPVRLTSRDKQFVAEGFVSNYSYHAGSLNIKLFGGQTKKILFRKNGITVDFIKEHSWMPPAAEMGLTDQDLADIAAYLKTL